MKLKIKTPIKVEYKHTNKADIAFKWLNSLPNLFAADFEVALKYSKEQIDYAKEKMNDLSLTNKERITYKSIANATPLCHPSHCTITHCSIAYSDSNAYVFLLDNRNIADVVLDFLSNTNKKQIWHNYCYDGKFIKYFTGKDVKNLEDTQILAKVLTNHVNPTKSIVGLKHLAGKWYGDWAISEDNFTKQQMYDDNIIEYAAIDSCATYKLYNHLINYINEQNKENN